MSANNTVGVGDGHGGGVYFIMSGSFDLMGRTSTW